MKAKAHVGLGRLVRDALECEKGDAPLRSNYQFLGNYIQT